MSRLALAAPTAAERLEYGDLVLYQSGVRCSNRGVHRNQQLLRGEQVEAAYRACEELVVGHAIGCLHSVAGLAEGLSIVERRTVICERLLNLFERRKHYLIERGQRSRLFGLGLPYPSARSSHIRERPADRRTDTPGKTNVGVELVKF